MLHPEVEKYLAEQRIKGGKARWAGTTLDQRRTMLEKARKASQAYFAELRKRKKS